MLNRKFEYCYEEDRLTVKRPTLADIEPSTKDKVMSKLRYLTLKFDNLDSFEYYTTKEEEMEKLKRKRDKYVWNQRYLNQR